MIIYDDKNKVFKLDTPHTSYIFGLAEGLYPCQLYYGKTIRDTDLMYLIHEDGNPDDPVITWREKTRFFDSYQAEYPFGGTGDSRESCLEIKTEDGQDGIELKYLSHEIFEGKKKLPGLPCTWDKEGDVTDHLPADRKSEVQGSSCSTLELTLQDEVTGIHVILYYTAFDDTDAITRSLRVENAGGRSIYLTKVLSACLHVERDDLEVLTLPGSWARERQIQRRPLGFGSIETGSLRGISSTQDHPFMALVTENCTQTTGDVYAMNFVYSGNFLAKAEKDQFGRTRMVMGIHPERFCWKLNPGECFQAPEVVMVYSDEGLGRMTRTFHKLYRKHLIRGFWKDRQRPVLINSWEAVYFDFDTEKLLSIAREASRAGIEMLVVDDGWFGCRNSDDCSLGDWSVNEEKLPGGLANLADEVNKLGLKLGIWMEPEMISEDSDLYRAHPDWALKVNGRIPGQCRAQYVLDLSRPEIVDYIYRKIKDILTSANIEYVKWDMNRPLTDVGNAILPSDRQGEIMHRYMLAVYDLQGRLTEDFPNLLLENCSGGGGRYDPGMLYYSPQIWCSDNTDAIERLSIQEGTALIYPLSTAGAHVSACPNSLTGRTVPFETRGNIALFGTFGYELDITKLSETERSQIPRQINLYKRYNALIRSGDYYRIASWMENHLYDCFMVVSEDRFEALVVYVQVLNMPNQSRLRIRLQGLDADAYYNMEGRRYQGAVLMYAGMVIPQMYGDFQSHLFYIKKCD